MQQGQSAEGQYTLAKTVECSQLEQLENEQEQLNITAPTTCISNAHGTQFQHTTAEVEQHTSPAAAQF